MAFKIVVLPGDGIGPEVTGQALKLLPVIGKKENVEFILDEGLIGATAIDQTGNPLPDETLDKCRDSDAVLLGAVGHPKFDMDPTAKVRPEQGLLKIRKSLGIQLSGGERRRTEIARALALNPNFILLDEPFAGVDPIAVEDIQEIVSKLREKNIGILITDHNVHETLAITDRAYLMFEGAILKAGTATQLAEDEQVRKVYLGQNFELR